MQKKQVFDTLILGGGAAGLYSALWAARSGQKVLLVEKTECLGKKLSMTGNGRCNFTHKSVSVEDYRTDDKKALQIALERYGVEETLDDFSSLGIFPTLKNDGYYPSSFQASSVVSLLRAALKPEVILTNHQVKGIEKEKEGFRVKVLDLSAKDKEKATSFLYGKRVIVCMGGASYPKTGSNGDGYYYMEKLGHHLEQPLPALTALLAEDYDAKLFGVRQNAVLRLTVKDNKDLILSSRGEVQFTRSGLSGIAVFQLSLEAAPLLSEGQTEGQKLELHCDFCPDQKKEELKNQIRSLIQRADPESDLSLFLCGLIQKQLAEFVLKILGLSGRKIREIRSIEQTAGQIADRLKDLVFVIKGQEGFASAQTTRGGVLLSEIDPETMESRLCPGLYLAGEIVNVNGFCGGYNLQWAWTSAYLAGTKKFSLK
ncbi:MAG: aminoacetone oxidase family FAD-binding enzyme [Lachnospiraceae bacterium]|nr:aminoacetone oxidase family FAD-binding enzyme [Lachnospiraceae bacterium]